MYDETLDLFDDPEIRPSLTKGIKNKRQISRTITIHKNIFDIIKLGERLNKKVKLKKDISLIRKVKVKKNQDRIIDIVENDPKYLPYKTKILEALNKINNYQDSPEYNTSIVISKSIKVKENEEIIKSLMSDPTLSSEEQAIAINLVKLCNIKAIPFLETLKTHFFLKNLYEMWVVNPDRVSDMGVGIYPITITKEKYLSFLFIVSYTKHKHRKSQKYRELLDIFDTRENKTQNMNFNVLHNIKERILSIHTRNALFRSTVSFLRDMGKNVAAQAAMTLLKILYLEREQLAPETESEVKQLEQSIRRLMPNSISEDLNWDDDQDDNSLELYHTILEFQHEHDPDEMFLFVVNPKLLQSDINDYQRYCFKNEWATQIEYQSIQTIENFVEFTCFNEILTADRNEHLELTEDMLLSDFLKLNKIPKKTIKNTLYYLLNEFLHADTHSELKIINMIETCLQKEENRYFKYREATNKKIKIVAGMLFGKLLNLCHADGIGYKIIDKTKFILKRK